MSFIHQKPRNADFLLSEANGQRSRDNIVLAPTDIPLLAGQLLAIDDEGLHVPYLGPTKTGTEEDPVFEEVPVVGVLYASVPASDDKQQAVKIARDAELIQTLLIGLDESAAKSLSGLGLLLR